MISFITIGRDDDYGGNFLNNFHTATLKNIEAIEEHNIQYEYVVVEWSPVRDYLIHNELFKDLFLEKSMLDVIIKPSVVVKENLNPNIFYEYFAKNAGIRRCKYDSLVIINADIVIPKETMKIIVDLVTQGLNKQRFYRTRNRVQVDDNLNILCKQDLHNPRNTDAVICGAYSGDILVIHKDTITNIAEGYDETNPKHRTISQASMDGEILWNLHNKGVTLEFINSEYWHINHTKAPTAGDYNMNGYINKPDWGYISYPQSRVNDKLIEIG